ncbi:GGDEF domain-containing protein [Psychrobium sp. 1_MG-2023]|uniref:GGDEF domain-containing protein n=1 Tax=Psychrobium sp. 1_MG-2023 TaxID=3062624 RepID=UPI000C31C159|nr:GGDEF domain-containing protein [Psychrobium sp. 1_MG-2023]MDP2560328.1 GGDEF domain-containing protein [Psychrobium sp. 1_MG-2023]PKF55439.1 GGDEF domain-containing protein [Alteromonadales bacterium alter-6D02]
MNKNILESVIEITKQRDSEAFGISLLATISELVPNAFISLFQKVLYPTPHFEVSSTLSTQKDEHGIESYIWDTKLPEATKEYIKVNVSKLIQMTVYQSADGMYHTFIPINIDENVSYAVDVASEQRHSKDLDSLIAITKLSQNFYSVLAISERDTLTGLFNRRTYEQKLNSLLTKQYNNQQHPLNTCEGQEHRQPKALGHTWLAMIDIDHFKKVNDEIGHMYGDEVLLVLSQLMQKSFRANDLLFRFGGEEFVIIFEPTSKENVANLLERFRKIVSQYHFPLVGHITISCGYAKITTHDHAPTILNNADQALYFAKDHGRNCVYNYENLCAEGEIQSPINDGNIELF